MHPFGEFNSRQLIPNRHRLATSALGRFCARGDGASGVAGRGGSDLGARRPRWREGDGRPRGGVGGGGRGAGGAEVISHVVGNVFYSVRENDLSGTSGL